MEEFLWIIFQREYLRNICYGIVWGGCSDPRAELQVSICSNCDFSHPG